MLSVGTDSRTSQVPETSPPEMASQHGSPKKAGRSGGTESRPTGDAQQWPQPGTCRRLCAHRLGAACGSHAVRGQSLLGANPALLPTRQAMAFPTPALNVPMQGHLQQQATKKPPLLPQPQLGTAIHPPHGSSSSSQSEFWPTVELQSRLPEPRALLLTARPQLLQASRHGKGTTLDQGPGVTGENWGGVGASSTIPAAQCQWARPAQWLVPREATEQSPLGHGRAMSGLPQHLHSPSQALSCVLLTYPGQNLAPSAEWTSLNQPGSEAWSPAAPARDRSAALC